MSQFLRNTSGQRVGFSAVDLDGVPATAGVDVYITIDGGTRTAAAGTLTHKGGGTWDYAFTQAETDGEAIVVDIGGTDIVAHAFTIYTTTKLVSDLNDITAASVWAVGTRELTGISGSIISGNITGTVGGIASVTFPSGFSTLTVGAIADAVWDEDITGHTTTDSAGAALGAAGSAGDPWSTSLPGSYTAGTAGYLIGTNLDAKVSETAKPGDEMDLIDTPNADAVTVIQAGLSTYDGSDTAGTTTLLSRIPDTISLAAINAQVDTALSNYDGPTNTEMVAAFTEIKGAGWSSSTDTLEKIADSIAGGGVDPSDIATAVWSAGARTLTAFTFDVTVASGSITAIQSGLATSSDIAALESHGDGAWATANISSLATSTEIALLKSHGDGAWATATGFTVLDDLTALQEHGDEHWATGGAGADQWATVLPGEYTEHQAGSLLARIDALAEKLNDMIEVCGSPRFKQFALSQAPGGEGEFAGPVEYSIEVQVGGEPQSNVLVYLTALPTSAAPRTKQLLTNTNGEVTFFIQPGQYYMWRYRADIDFPNPVQITVPPAG